MNNHWYHAAIANVQRYIGDLDAGSLEDPEVFYEEVYTLAHDGAVDMGATMEAAQDIAQRIASKF